MNFPNLLSIFHNSIKLYLLLLLNLDSYSILILIILNSLIPMITLMITTTTTIPTTTTILLIIVSLFFLLYSDNTITIGYLMSSYPNTTTPHPND